MRTSLLRPLFLLLFLLYALRGALAAGESGMLTGNVELDDGIPCPQFEVTVQAGNHETRVRTDNAGTFRSPAPAGAVTVRCRDAQAAVTVTAGQIARVAVVIHPTGIVLTVAVEHGSAPAWYSAAGAFRRTGGEKHDLKSLRLRADTFWFPDVPAEATAFAALLRFPADYAPAGQRQQWHFTTPAPLRRLRMALSIASCTVQVTGDNHAPCANAVVSGRLDCAFPASNDYWTPDAELPLHPARVFTQLSCDGQGNIHTGLLLAGHYTLSLTVAGKMGAPLSVTVGEDGTITPGSYSLRWQPHSLTQTVRRTDGTLAAHTEVAAAYCWEGKVTTLQGKTDAQGHVRWEQLPPAALATWGSGLAPQLLPADARGEIAVPPAPAPHEPVIISFRLSGLGNTTTSFTWIWDNGRERKTIRRPYRPEMVPVGELAQDIAVTPGMPFTLAAISNTSPPRVALLLHACAPDCLSLAPPVWEMPFQGGATLQGRLLNSHNLPVPHVAHLALLPMELKDVPEELEEFARDLQPVYQSGDGAFQAAVLLPGVYRLLIDLDEATVPPLPGTLFTLQPGENDLTITLPEPLATVQGQTVLHWVTRDAPQHARQMPIDGAQLDQPIYGPADEVTALWYLENKETLVLREAVPGQPPVTRRETRRQVSLSVLDAHEQPSADLLMLAPLFPPRVLPRDEDQTTEPYLRAPVLSADKAETSMALTNLLPNQPSDLLAWPGRYAILDRNDPVHLLALLDIPNQGAPQLSTHETPGRRLPSDAPLVTIHPRLPAVPAEGRHTASTTLSITADTPTSNLRARYGQAISAEVTADVHTVELQVPATAHRLTACWPGLGVMRDVPMPKDPAQPFDLPAWQPGLTVSGVVRGADGAPLAHAALHLGARAVIHSDTAPVVTDAAGHFSVSGLLPGVLYITLDAAHAGWVRELPAAGLPALDLRVPAQPIRFFYLTDLAFLQYWWIPDHGKARRLYGYEGNGCADLDFTPGEGWFWALNPVFGDAICQHIVIPAGRAEFIKLPFSQTPRPSLGLTFPLDMRQGLPGTVTLQGEGALAAIHIEFPDFSWLPCAELDQVVGQINSLPSGHYRVTVETAAGEVTRQVTVGEYGGEIRVKSDDKDR